MRLRRRSVLWAITVLAVASLTGCAPRACAGAAQWPPGVWLDPSPWLEAHPRSALTVCLSGRCERADDTTNSILQLVVSNRSHSPKTGEATYLLTITSRNSTPLKVQARVTLQQSHVTNPCGTQTWWQADGRLDAAGHLSIWHGTSSGPFAPQVPRPITSAPTADN